MDLTKCSSYYLQGVLYKCMFLCVKHADIEGKQVGETFDSFYEGFV